MGNSPTMGTGREGVSEEIIVELRSGLIPGNTGCNDTVPAHRRLIVK